MVAQAIDSPNSPFPSALHDSPSDNPPIGASGTHQNQVDSLAVRRWKWSAAQYLKLTELGFFDNRRVELIDGEIIDMAAMSAPHATALGLVEDALQPIFRENFFLRIQLPLEFGEFGQPETDVAVIAGARRDFRDSHPATAVLAVEISFSTLEFDRREKAGLYARAGIPEYWILNLRDNQLEIFRRPEVRPDAPFGWGYMDISLHRSGAHIATLAAPDASLAVADLLP